MAKAVKKQGGKWVFYSDEGNKAGGVGAAPGQGALTSSQAETCIDTSAGLAGSGYAGITGLASTKAELAKLKQDLQALQDISRRHARITLALRDEVKQLAEKG